MSPAAFITDIVKVTVKGTSSILQYSRALFLKIFLLKTVINPRNTQSLLSAWFMFSNWGTYMNLPFCVLNMFAKWWDVPTWLRGWTWHKNKTFLFESVLTVGSNISQVSIYTIGSQPWCWDPRGGCELICPGCQMVVEKKNNKKYFRLLNYIF